MRGSAHGTGKKRWSVLQWLAARLLRGPDAPYVLTDLDDALDRDLARGLTVWQAHRRYVINAVASAWALSGILRYAPTLPFSLLDVKLGFRMLGRQPGLTAVAVFALAIGIPVGMAPWQFASAIEAPLPVPDGARIQLLRYWNVATSRTDATTSYDYARWRAELASFDSLAAVRASSYNVGGDDGTTEPVAGAEVSASAFDLLRVPPLKGRTLLTTDETPGGAAVVVIGHDLWQSRLGADPDVVGRSVLIGADQHTVVGVMPEGFLFPSRQQLWLPLRERAAVAPRQGLPLFILGRLANGVGEQEAQAELTSFGRRMSVEYPEEHAALRAEVVPSAFMVFAFPRGGLRSIPEFYVGQFAALLLLSVACANVGMLIFARTSTRTAELSVRTALGASRARIVAQVFTESLVLAVLASGVGLLIINWLPERLLAAANITSFLPYWVDPGVTAGAALRALTMAVFSAALAGVIPALRATGRSVHGNIQRARAGSSGRRFGGLSGALVVADVAIAVMVVGLGAGITSLAMQIRNAPDGVGIEADEYLAAQLRLPGLTGALADSASSRQAFAARVRETQQELVRRLAEEPDVRGVAVGSVLPRMDHPNRRIEIDGEEFSEGAPLRARLARVDVGFFESLEQPILSGRGFTASDVADGSAVAIVNTTFVDRMMNGRNPIGRRLRHRGFDATESSRWYEIVGVVGHLGMHVLQPPLDEGVYLPAAPGELHPVHLAIHVGDDPESFIPRLRALALEVDATAVIVSPQALDGIYEGDWYIMAGTAMGGAVLVATLLALAASALYAIMSFTVAQRTREIGIRAALGAHRSSIVRMVAGRSLAQIITGVLLGLPLAGWIFFELAEGDAAATWIAAAGTVGLGVGVMTLVGLAGCAAPTLRALRVMPTEALRGEG